MKSMLENLQLFIGPKCFYIAGSIHKYALGNNFSQFDFSKFLAAIEKLERCLQIDGSLMSIKKLEYGFNLKGMPSIRNITAQVLEYGKKRFLPMYKDHQGRQYGIKRSMAKTELKIYDKAFEALVHHQQETGEALIRVEYVYRYKSRLPNINNLGDLKNEKAHNRLMAQLLQSFDRIIFDPIDYSGLRPMQIVRVWAAKSEGLWTMLEAVCGQKRTGKIREEFLSISKVGRSTLKKQMKEALRQTFLDLMER